MLPAEIKVGHVFRYSYLWHWQHREGREDGDKDRPCLVLALVTMQEDGSPVVRVLPITHTPRPIPMMPLRSRLRSSCACGSTASAPGSF